MQGDRFTLGSGRRRARFVFAATSIAAGALCAASVETLLAAQPLPSPLARDEEFVVRFSGTAPLAKVLAGGITVTSPSGAGTPAPRGTFVAGRELIDADAQRAVIVRPEALREYFVLVKGLARADADVQAQRTLARVEKTGDLRPLAAIDAAMHATFGPLSGTRLDDVSTFANYPAQLPVGSPLSEFRKLVAGDDALYDDYYRAGNISAFATLQQDSRFERFFHPVDTKTGNPSAESVLRQREHRRVLMRRTKNLLTFIPEIPNLADLTDAGYAAGATYDVNVTKKLRGATKDVQPARGGVLKFAHGLASLRIADDTGDGGVFLGGTPWNGTSTMDGPPRVVNVTPPSAESSVDPTTDWEDPDNQFAVALPQRRPFVVRLRYAQPLDPRTVDAAHFTLTKVAVLPNGGGEIPMSVPVNVSVVLKQSRMGEILVEIRPQTILDPNGRYALQAASTVKSLDGSSSPVAFVTSFQTN